MADRPTLKQHEALEYIIRELDTIKQGVNKIMATQAQVLEEIRKAQTVSQGMNVAVREAIELLKQGRDDPAKNDEAISLLQAIQADDSAVLTENTAAEDEGSGEGE